VCPAQGGQVRLGHAEPLAEKYVVDCRDGVEQPACSQMTQDLLSDPPEMMRDLSNEGHPRDGEEAGFAGLELQDAAAVSPPYRLGTEQCHRVQRGDGKEFAAELTVLVTKVDAVHGIEVAGARRIRCDSRGVGVHAGDQQVRWFE
jgi:hypothetical protein